MKHPNNFPLGNTFMSEHVDRKVIGIISKATKIPEDRIQVDTDLETLGIDSLDSLTIISDVERAFDITITDEDAHKLRTVRQIVDLLKQSHAVSE